MPLPVDQFLFPAVFASREQFIAYAFARVLLVSLMGVGVKDDVRKLQFTFDGPQQQQDPFQDPVELDSDLLEALSWSAGKSVEQAGLVCPWCMCALVLCLFAGDERKRSNYNGLGEKGRTLLAKRSM